MSSWLALRVDMVIRVIRMHVNLKYLRLEMARCWTLDTLTVRLGYRASREVS
jgi:hypothetical protein